MDDIRIRVRFCRGKVMCGREGKKGKEPKQTRCLLDLGKNWGKEVEAKLWGIKGRKMGIDTKRKKIMGVNGALGIGRRRKRRTQNF